MANITLPQPQPIPADVQYWFNYCAQWNNAPGGNVLHLFPNGLAIPVNTPLVGGPPAQPAPFNGPALISDPDHGQRPDNQRHPTPKGWGVFLGFYAVQDPNLPVGNNSSDPMRWCVVYGRYNHPKKARSQRRRPQPSLAVWRRSMTYMGLINDQGRTQRIRLNDVRTIQSLRGLDDAQVLNYVHMSTIREQGNNPGEYNANFNHLRALQWAHVNSLPATPRRQALQTSYGI